MEIWLTCDNQILWDVAFKLVSIKRCIPILSLLGLSSELVENSESLITFSRGYLRTRAIYSGNFQESLGRQQSCLIETFDFIEQAYSKEIADAFYRWCSLWVTNVDLSSSWHAWGTLLHYACIGDELDEDESPPLLESLRIQIRMHCNNEDQQSVICQIEQQIALAKIKALDDWEEWLELEIQNQAGDEDSTGAIESAFDLIEAIANLRSTTQVLQRIRSTCSESDQSLLISWSHQQAEMLGIPVHYIDYGWLAIGKRALST